MRRKSGRRLGQKHYRYIGTVQIFDFETQQLLPERIPVFYNVIDGPYHNKFKYSGTAEFHSSEFTVEVLANFLIKPEDRFNLQDGSYGTVENNRLKDNDTYNRKRRQHKKNKITYFEQLIFAG